MSKRAFNEPFGPMDRIWYGVALPIIWGASFTGWLREQLEAEAEDDE